MKKIVIKHRNRSLDISNLNFFLLCCMIYLPFINYNLFQNGSILLGIAYSIILILTSIGNGLLKNIFFEIKECKGFLIACLIVCVLYMIDRIPFGMFLNYSIVFGSIPIIKNGIELNVKIWCHVTIFFGILFVLFGRRGMNTNTIGIIMYICCGACIICMIHKKVKWPVPFLVLYGYCLYISGCRSAILSLVVLVFSIVFGKVIVARQTVYKIYCILGLAMLVLIPLVYMFFYNTGIEFNLFGVDKPLYTNREIIWQQYINLLNRQKSWLWGIKNLYSINILGYNLHNSLLGGIVMVGGIATFAFFFNILSLMIKKYNLLKRNKKNQALMYLFIGILIINTTETSIMTYTFCIMMYLPLLLINGES